MIDMRQVTVRYGTRAAPTVSEVDLRVAPGELVLVSGPTGCGKSTIINCINGVLLHESDAVVEGEVKVSGLDVRETPLSELCRVVGSVFQNPETQLCTATPETEVAFGLENLAVPRPEMRARIDEALHVVGLSEMREQPVGTLSGGQKQRLAIACAVALNPRVLLLDEPISQLDPEGAEGILNTLARLMSEYDQAVLVVEHRLEEVARLADRVAVMRDGRVWSDLPVKEAFLDLAPLRDLGLSLPHMPDLFCRLGRPERPFSPEEAPLLEVRNEASPETSAPTEDEALASFRSVTFAYGKQSPPVLEGLSLELRRGDRVALMGGNGSGKSTLLNLLAGALQPVKGSMAWHDGATPRIGLMVQQPDLMLFQPTVWDEALFAPKHQGLTLDQAETHATRALEQMSMLQYGGEPAFALSRGQRLRTAVASILSMQPEVVLLDEPTTGQDREQIERMMDGLAEGLDLLVFCTHDVDTAARHANRVLLLADGGVIADGPPSDVLFDEEALRRAAIRPSSSQVYARRLGVRALGVAELLEKLR